MSLPKLRQGISGALKDTGLKKLDLVGFDMCLMAEMETAAEIADLAQVMVASQALEPGDGWPYEQILPAFGEESLGVGRLGAQIVDAYGKHYGGRQEQVATLSAIDLGEVQKLAETMNTLAAKMSRSVPASWPAISRAFFYSEAYADRTDIRKGLGGLASVDLLDLLKRLRHAVTPFPADQEYQDLVGIMDRAVIASCASPGTAQPRPGNLCPDDGASSTIRIMSRSNWLRRVPGRSFWPPGTKPRRGSEHSQISDLKVVDAQSGQAVKGGKPVAVFALRRP